MTADDEPNLEVLVLADRLDQVRAQQVCAYLAPTGQVCDCKFRPSPISIACGLARLTDEMTGCCEMRVVIDLLRDLGGDTTSPRLPGHRGAGT